MSAALRIRGGTILAVIGCLAAGCQRGDERFVGGLHAFAMTPDTPPAFETEEGPAYYLVEQRIGIPIRAPTDGVLAGLDPPPDVELPFPRLPWVDRDDLELVLDWVLRRVDDDDASTEAAEVDVVVNGENEFSWYAPGFVSDENGVVPFFAQWERRFALAPGESVTDSVGEHAMAEVAIDLATLVNGPPDPNVVVTRDSRRDPETRAFVPAAVPGLVAVRVGLRATVPGSFVLETTLRVRDPGGRLAGRGEASWSIRPRPVAFSGADVIANAEEPGTP